VQAVNRSNSTVFQNAALEKHAAPKAFHSQHGYVLSQCLRYNQLGKAPEMRIHNVDRHLHSIEVKAVPLRHFQHGKSKAFVMTKIDGRTKETATNQINDSLKRLKVEHIDLLQHHEILRYDALMANKSTLSH
jgi:hypothetical protein